MSPLPSVRLAPGSNLTKFQDCDRYLLGYWTDSGWAPGLRLLEERADGEWKSSVDDVRIGGRHGCTTACGRKEAVIPGGLDPASRAQSLHGQPHHDCQSPSHHDAKHQSGVAHVLRLRCGTWHGGESDRRAGLEGSRNL